MVIFVFDGSFNGLLSAVFEFYERKPKIAKLVWQKYHQPALLDESTIVFTDNTKAERVWKGLEKKLSQQGLKMFYKAYLSEQPEVLQKLFDFARYIFDNPKGAEHNFGNPYVLAIANTARKVDREKHRMKAFVRFQKTIDGIYYAPIEPDFNVLPLIATFFKERYADQYWVIYDVKRKYGLYYNLETVTQINYEFASSINTSKIKLPEDVTDETELLSSTLWKDYFNSTNIPERKNTKLHLQHVPKRYWKYLNEKEGKN